MLAKSHVKHFSVFPVSLPSGKTQKREACGRVTTTGDGHEVEVRPGSATTGPPLDLCQQSQVKSRLTNLPYLLLRRYKDKKS